MTPTPEQNLRAALEAAITYARENSQDTIYVEYAPEENDKIEALLQELDEEMDCEDLTFNLFPRLDA